MQMQQYKRAESLPVAYTPQNGPLAERNGHNGNSDRNGFPALANGQAAHPGAAVYPQFVQAPTYLQILTQQVRKRWKLLAVWLVMTAAVAFGAIKSLGVPMWRAEGTFFYQPDYGYSPHPLYVPPNIQSVLRDMKSPDVLEKLRAEKNISAGLSTLLTKINAKVDKNSEYITFSFDWSDPSRAEEFTNRLMELAVESFNNHREINSKQALAKLNENLQKTINDELALSAKMSKFLGEKVIYDLANTQVRVQGDISNYESQRSQILVEKTGLESQQRALESNDLSFNNGELTTEELNLRASLATLRAAQQKRLHDIMTAKEQLKAKESERNSNLRLYQTGAMSRQDWEKLNAEIKILAIAANSTQELRDKEAEIKKLEDEILSRSKNPKSAQTLFALTQVRASLKAIPDKLRSIEGLISELRQRQLNLAQVEREVLPMQNDIKSLNKRRLDLEAQKQEHEKLEGPSSELKITSPAKVSDAPVSSNHPKLAGAVFAISILLFVGLVAVRDMPRAVAEAKAAFAQIPPAHMSAQTSNLPVPAWNNPQTQPAMRAPDPVESGEHLRALAARIAQNVTDRGSIVLFTPAVEGLRIESLVADLGCYYAQHGGRVLVFDSRPMDNMSTVPAWAGPKAEAAGEEVQSFLVGQSDDPTACFASTLISSIDYSRGDLSKLLSGVLTMYRFRQLVQEMRNYYSLVLLITSEMYRGGDDDVLSSLAEGVVIVLNEGANPAEVDAYIRNLNANDTTVYGAVTVPGRVV